MVSLIDTWLEHARARPDAPAFHTADTGWVSHGQLDVDSRAIAAAWAHAGLTSGSRVLFSCPPSYGLVAAHVAALRAGLVVIPANTAYREPELAHIARDGDVAAVVVPDEERAGWVRGAAPDAVWLRPEVAAPAPEPVPGPAPEPALPPLPSADDPAMISYTSGTTGRPKGALLSHANVVASARGVATEWDWTTSDRLILALPLFHMHGLGVGVHGVLFTGGSAVLMPAFDPGAVLAAITDHQATMFFGVPTMYERLLRADGVERLADLRLCVSGSAPLGADTWRELRERTGQPVLERYGMTETLMLTSNPGDPARGERRPGTVGRPLPGIEVRIDGSEGVGEIQVRGASVFDGYWRNPEATAEAFTADGWFRTGDLGAVEDGYLRIAGRSKELIITGGYNVYPREVEDAVARHPDVLEVAVVGRPSREWGETVTAFVVLRPGATLDVAALDAVVAEQVADYKRPRAWEVVPALPRNAMGKVVKGELV